MTTPQESNTQRAAVAHQRLVRRLERRDKRIAGLERKIQKLEEALSWRSMDLESLSRNVRREVQDALCNVRMIPVHGLSSMNQIVEVKTTPEESKLRRQIRQLLEHRGHVAAEAIIDRWADEFSSTNAAAHPPADK